MAQYGDAPWLAENNLAQQTGSDTNEIEGASASDPSVELFQPFW